LQPPTEPLPEGSERGGGLLCAKHYLSL